MRASLTGVAALVAAAAITSQLVGCAPQACPIFDRASTSDDVLPADFESFDDGQLENYDLDTVRLAATFNETDLFLLRSVEGDTCLAVPNGERSVIACGRAGQFGTTVNGVGAFEVAPAPIQGRDGWTVLSDNIRVSD
jgi:hypothetical protein